MATVRIETQYQENYSDTDVPHWKMKGGQVFTVECGSDTVMYADNIEAVIVDMLEVRSNDHCKYTYLAHEVLFSQPEVLSAEIFLEKVQTQWKAANDEA